MTLDKSDLKTGGNKSLEKTDIDPEQDQEIEEDIHEAEENLDYDEQVKFFFITLLFRLSQL